MSKMPVADAFTHAVAGAGGGALAMAVTYPLVTLSTLAQTKSKRTEGDEEEDKETRVQKLVAAVKKIYVQDGLPGFYTGLESALYGIGFTNFVYYYFYERTSKVILRRKTRGLSTLESMLTGTIAGSVTALATNPIWVANTRMTTTKTSQSTISTMIDIIRKDGPQALLSGLLPALVLVINPIIQYTLFEQIKNLLNKVRGKGMTSLDAFFIGAFGKLIATGVTYPYITLKARMHLNNTLGLLKLMKKIYKEEGIAGFYNGIGVKLSQSIMTAAFLFYFKEELVIASIKMLALIHKKKTVKT